MNFLYRAHQIFSIVRFFGRIYHEFNPVGQASGLSGALEALFADNRPGGRSTTTLWMAENTSP
jgi:hypothetical protein